MTKKLHIRRDDTVVVISGKDKGKKGKVLRAIPKEGKVVVEGVNMLTRHTKPRAQGQTGGIVHSEGAIYASKVMLLQSSSGRQEGTRMQKMRGGAGLSAQRR